MKHLPLPFILALFFASFCPLHAQVGINNPTGASGIFNGQVNTGCSYDPYTGNATRSITDIAVAGAVGEYPLALVRTANSRTPSVTGVFGNDGGWNHNYNWTMEDSPVTHTQNFHPVKYTVNFPDGRVETFRAVTWDTIYRVRPGPDTPAQSTSAGVRERFLQLNLNSMYAYLILPDGGAVEFRAEQKYDPAYGRYWYTYHVTGIYDPHGLKTTIDSEVVGQAHRRRITKVTEPAGRYLQFIYRTQYGPQISQVQEFINGVGRRSVQYQYYLGYLWLESVVYYGNNAWTARYQYTGSNIGGDLPFLLHTCDDPMYPGPMHKIAYTYRSTDNYTGNHPGYGQISSENYYDGTNVGVAVSTLTVPNATTRTETRGDGKTRTFTYTAAGYLTSCTDFMSHSASQGYDSKNYLNYVTDRRGNRTDYTNDPITGNVLQIQFPFTHEDTPNQSVRPTISYIYGGGAGCLDPNNGDPYWVCTITDEAGNETRFTRDPTFYRVTRIDYPDGGYETFAYDQAHFYKLSSHRMVTGGTETFAYDSGHRLQYYSDPYHGNPGNPSITHYYDGLDRLSGVVDNLNHSVNFDYNDRGQVTVTTLPWINGVRYTISNLYNPDGTLQKRTDELGHLMSYLYDNYRRLKSVTPPVRGSGDTGTYTTRFCYGANPWDAIDDYKLTDSNVTYIVPPSTGTKKIKTVYDDNRRKTSVTVAPGTADEATTGYGYDNVGNVTSVTNPLNRRNVSTLYDVRNRPYSITEGSQPATTITYDTFGRQKTTTRPNGQVITNFSFDAMNRVTRRDVTQTPTGVARSNYSYFPGSGLLQNFQDPHIFTTDNSGEHYGYLYDRMGRKTWVTYPHDQNGVQRTEHFTYDGVGRLDTFKNRAGNIQSFAYDALNRLTGFNWDDGLTPSVSFGYDAVSRLININNANANITRAYYNDNLLRSETEQILLLGGRSKTTSYTYDADGNRASTTYPDVYAFGYTYTGRNQLQAVNNWATYVYDARGNPVTRTLVGNGKHSDYIYDARDRVTSATHTLNVTRGFNYGYHANSDNRKYAKRTWTGLGEVFAYDLADQVTAVQHNIANPDTTPVPGQNIIYDSNGNRIWYTSTGVNKHYDVNGTASNLNQYNDVTINGSSYNFSYSGNANLVQYGYNTSSYSYDAQNRLTSATVGGQTMYFDYDALNRQVSRRIGANGTRTFNIWDGWDLIEEYQGANPTAYYLYGATGLIASAANGQFNYYFQDGSGSTSQVTDENGALKEWYRYDLQGAPFIYDANNNQLSATARNVRHLFTGQQWYRDVGLYDLRNRFYCPDIGRFLQPDPIGFRGGNNLYRYCRNNPVTRWDGFGLQDAVNRRIDGRDVPEVEEVRVTGRPVESVGAPSGAAGGGGGGEAGGRGGRGGSVKLTGITFSYGKPPQNSNSTQQQPPGVMVGFDIYHPTTTAEFIIAGNIIEGGDTTDTTVPIDPIDILSGGIAGLTRGFVRTAARAAQQRTITVLGSRRAIEAGGYVTRPRFNVFRPAANMTKQEIDRANAEWLNAALVRGDEIWLVTHPEQHARFLQSLPPGAFESSNYIHLELPMLEQYKAVESIIGY